MQLMPKTAETLGVQDVFDPQQNVDGGVRYLKDLLDQHDDDVSLALAAYNAGPTAVARHGGIPPYPETKKYVKRVLEIYEGGSDK
jgi:soluble lytic murein transglycosylase-like protein